MRDGLLAGTLSTTRQEQFLLTEDPVKAVLASAFVGQFLGAIVLGRLADRVGRRRMFLGFFQAAGPIHILVNNVGQRDRRGVTELTPTPRPSSPGRPSPSTAA